MCNPAPRKGKTMAHSLRLRCPKCGGESRIVAEAPWTRRRSRGSALGVLAATAVANCLGAWILRGAPDLPTRLTMEVYDRPKAAPAEPETAASRDETTSIPPGNLAGEPWSVNLVSIEKQASGFEEQTKSPAPSVGATPTEIAPSAIPAGGPGSVSSTPPATRSIALLSSASERTQFPAPTAAPPAVPAANPEPK